MDTLENFLQIVGDNLRLLRRDSGHSQSELAQSLDIQRATLGKYEQAKAPIRLDVLYKIASFFEVKVSDLLFPGMNMGNGLKQALLEQNKENEHLKRENIRLSQELEESRMNLLYLNRKLNEETGKTYTVQDVVDSLKEDIDREVWRLPVMQEIIESHPKISSEEHKLFSLHILSGYDSVYIASKLDMDQHAVEQKLEQLVNKLRQIFSQQ